MAGGYQGKGGKVTKGGPQRQRWKNNKVGWSTGDQIDNCGEEGTSNKVKKVKKGEVVHFNDLAGWKGDKVKRF